MGERRQRKLRGLSEVLQQVRNRTKIQAVWLQPVPITIASLYSVCKLCFMSAVLLLGTCPDAVHACVLSHSLWKASEWWWGTLTRSFHGFLSWQPDQHSDSGRRAPERAHTSLLMKEESGLYQCSRGKAGEVCPREEYRRHVWVIGRDECCRKHY